MVAKTQGTPLSNSTQHFLSQLLVTTNGVEFSQLLENHSQKASPVLKTENKSSHCNYELLKIM